MQYKKHQLPQEAPLLQTKIKSMQFLEHQAFVIINLKTVRETLHLQEIFPAQKQLNQIP